VQVERDERLKVLRVAGILRHGVQRGGRAEAFKQAWRLRASGPLRWWRCTFGFRDGQPSVGFETFERLHVSAWPLDRQAFDRVLVAQAEVRGWLAARQV